MTAYLSVEEADAYHNLRMSKAAWAALDEEEKARRLVSASDFLDVNYRFMGEKADPIQLRQFPRKGFESLKIPTAIIYAVCELALQENLNQNAEQKMTSVKVGSLSVNYDNRSTIADSSNRFDYVRQLLVAWLDRNSFGVVKLERG